MNDEIIRWLKVVKLVHQTQNWGNGDKGLWIQPEKFNMEIIYPDGDHCAHCFGNLGAPEVIESQNVADIILLAPQVADYIAELEKKLKEQEEMLDALKRGKVF